MDNNDESFIEEVYIHWNVGAILILAVVIAVSIAVGVAIAYSNGVLK